MQSLQHKRKPVTRNLIWYVNQVIRLKNRSPLRSEGDGCPGPNDSFSDQILNTAQVYLCV